MLEQQKRVADAVARRGYREGWSDEDFVRRQIVKLVEEVAELGQGLDGPEWWIDSLWPLNTLASRAFDDFDDFKAFVFGEIDLPTIFEEMADIQVVLFVLADALGVDVVQMAIKKAENDVKRGVRKEVL